jgi:hypothetical protein
MPVRQTLSTHQTLSATSSRLGKRKSQPGVVERGEIFNPTDPSARYIGC